MHTFALAFGKQASFRPAGGEGAAAEGCCGGVETAGNENRLQKKLKKNLEVTNFLLIFAKFFRLTKTEDRRVGRKRDGKSPRTLKDLQ